MNFEQFVEEIAKNPSLAETLQHSISPDEAYKVAQEAGLNLSMEEFLTSMGELNEACTEMNPDDVDAIAGGSTTTQIVSAVATGVGAASSAAATIASASGAAC